MYRWRLIKILIMQNVCFLCGLRMNKVTHSSLSHSISRHFGPLNAPSGRRLKRETQRECLTVVGSSLNSVVKH